MIGALAEGTSHITNFLEAEDCLHTMQALQELGVLINHTRDKGQVRIEGSGLRGLSSPSGDTELYLGNSGTSMRLLLGILAGQPLEVTLSGDDSLSARPMRRVTDPLKQMGAQIKGGDQGNFSPLRIRGGRLKGIQFENKWGSAQVKSALLFAGLNAEGTTRIVESFPSRDHTERMLAACGAGLETERSSVVIRTAERLSPLEMEIPGDFSSAAFFIVGAALTKGSELIVERVGLNPTRTGLIRVLRRMGANLSFRQERETPEPLGSLSVKGGALKGTRITKEEIPSLIDELPILMIAMALAEGESLISGAAELRVKETDRLHSMAVNLEAVGGQIEELKDGCLIRGVESFQEGRVSSMGDHRTAMSFAIASLAARGEIKIEGTECIATSFPSFFDHFRALIRHGSGSV